MWKQKNVSETKINLTKHYKKNMCTWDFNRKWNRQNNNSADSVIYFVVSLRMDFFLVLVVQNFDKSLSTFLIYFCFYVNIITTHSPLKNCICHSRIEWFQRQKVEKKGNVGNSNCDDQQKVKRIQFSKTLSIFQLLQLIYQLTKTAETQRERKFTELYSRYLIRFFFGFDCYFLLSCFLSPLISPHDNRNISIKFFLIINWFLGWS